jgi:signal peptidase I
MIHPMITANKTMHLSRSPRIAGALSLIMPGLGQIYAGSFVRGLACMSLTGVFCVLGLLALAHPSAFSWTLGCAFGLAQCVVWIAAIVDARQLALRCKADYELKDYNRWYVYVLLMFLTTGGALAYGLYVRGQVLQPFIVPGPQMFPTIAPGDRVLALKNAYRKSDPQRGDLVLFASPENRSIFWIKRVVAIAGDTVETKGTDFYVNGAKLPHEYIGPSSVKANNLISSGDTFYEINNGAKYRIFFSKNHPEPAGMPLLTIPKYQCFVLADNRNDSLDSRHFGPIPVAGILGRFDYRYGPITEWSRLGKIQ